MAHTTYGHCDLKTDTAQRAHSVKSTFLPEGQKKPPPKPLEVGPHSGLYMQKKLEAVSFFVLQVYKRH